MKMSADRQDGRVSRRTLLSSLVTTTGVTIAGCSEPTDSVPDEQATLEPGASSPDSSPAESSELEKVKADLGTVYESITTLPVVRNGEFVFDVKAFENDFDHDELVTDLENTEGRIRNLDSEIVSDTERQTLLTFAGLAKRLVRQRLLVHQVIAAGLTYERRFIEQEYEEATEAIRIARYYLNELASNGERIEGTLDDQPESEVVVDGYDPDSFSDTQEILAEVALWTDPAYEGLHHAIRGFSRIEKGKVAISSESYGNAAEAFGASKNHFDDAVGAFDRAHGRGRELPHVRPLVEHTRCTLQAYLEGSNRLQDAMNALDAGDREQGKDIARTELEMMKRKMDGCS